MARGPNNEALPQALLEQLPWSELLQRLTAMAAIRLGRHAAEDARQLAMEAVRVFIDPGSSVTWNYENEPDPRRCLGSILNGLLRNYVRARRTNSEIASDPSTLERAAGSTDEPSAEDKVAQREHAEAVLQRVQELSTSDAIVLQLIVLTRSGHIDIEEQAAILALPRATLYEARRRLRERVEAARSELEKNNA